MKDKCCHCGKIGLGIIDPETEERVVLCLEHMLWLYFVKIKEFEEEHGKFTVFPAFPPY